MRLILLRHAEAEERDSARFPDDGLRPLTREGIKVQTAVAKALKRMGLVPDRIVTSPLVRAKQTADITARILSLEQRLEESDALGEGFSVANVLRLLEGSDKETVMLVGHEPDLSGLAGALLGPGEGPDIRFKKSAVLGLEFDGKPEPGGAALLFFYRPKDLLAA